MHFANPKRDGFPPESCNLLFQDFQFWTGKDFLLFVDEDGLFRKDSLKGPVKLESARGKFVGF